MVIRARLRGFALAAALFAVVATSIYSLRLDPPAPLDLLLLPGVAFTLALGGGTGHELDRDLIAFFNIIVWSIVLTTAAAFVTLSKRPRATSSLETNQALVPVYVSHNPAELPVVESLLAQAGIKFMVKGEQIQGMFGAGQFGGTNLIVSLEICVLPSDVEAVRALLASTTPPPTGEPAV